MIRTTRWKPDTCGCTLEYTWDDTVAEDVRTHTMSKMTKCVIHSALPEVAAYQAVHDENRSKNDGIGLLVAQHPELEPQQHLVGWRFEQDRSVVIALPSGAKSSKNTLNNLANGAFPKKVTFE